MFYQTESKAQGWRALAVYEDGRECLLYVGRSTTQVRAGYKEAYQELLDDEERAQVRRISLQCWDGAPDRGRWVTKASLSLPYCGKVLDEVSSRRLAFASAPARTPVATTESKPQEPHILPFRRLIGAQSSVRPFVRPEGAVEQAELEAKQPETDPAQSEETETVVLPLIASA